jgi:hypothetical protein
MAQTPTSLNLNVEIHHCIDLAFTYLIFEWCVSARDFFPLGDFYAGSQSDIW